MSAENEGTSTGESTGTKRHGIENLVPPWKPGQSGNPEGRKKGSVRNWSAVMREFFEMVEDDPEKLERLTGMKLPTQLKGKDGQLLLVFNQYVKAMKGDARARAEIMDRMDGLARQHTEVSGALTVNIVKYSDEKAEPEGKAEVETGSEEKENEEQKK